LERLRAAREEDLHAIHGIGEAMARSVVTGLQEKAPLLDRLLEVVTLVTPDTPTVTGHALSGKSVVFTGTLTRMDRKEAQRRVVALGGKTPTAVTRDLDYLVSGKEKDGAESTKVKAARRLVATGARVKVITEEEFLGLL
jgi:NAD-dependent DNA ligase